VKTRRPARLPKLPFPASGLPLAGARRAIQAYASAPSAPAGGTMEFRVSVPSRAACSVAVRRIGTPVPTPAVRFVGEDQDGAAVTWVRVSGTGDDGTRGGGTGDRNVGGAGWSAVAGPGAAGRPGGETGPGGAGRGASGAGGTARSGAGIGSGAASGFGAVPGEPAPAGDLGIPLTWCDWEPSLLLDIPESWPPGLYVARFSVEAPLLSMMALRGRSAYVPFVVRGPLAAGFPTLVILPFAAYTAANPWPIADARRARAVSFDRPFAGNGLPAGFDADAAFVEPLTATDFATSLDLHAGLIDPGAYRKVLFRADLWSPQMRSALARASLSGTDVGGLDGIPPPSVDFAPGPDGRDHRILIRC
jgi:hypothetical protein